MNSFFNNLINRDGVFYSSKISQVSYPIEATQTIYEIEDNSFWFHHRNDCIIKLINRFKPKGLIFEIGGGNGFVLKTRLFLNFSIYGTKDFTT